jgi:hypothetical protein
MQMAAKRGRVVVSVGLQVISVRPNDPPWARQESSP